MAQIAVNSLLIKLSSLLEEESQTTILFTRPEELSSAIEEVESMMKLLTHAEATEENSLEFDEAAEQVRACAYDLEDILDESMLGLADDREHPASEASTKFQTKLAKMKRSFKSCEEAYSIFEDASNFPADVYLNDGLRESISLWTYGFREGLVGTSQRIKELIHMIDSGGSNLRVVSVTGMGGLGKTTLALKVYQSRELRKDSEINAWIYVSQLFGIEDFLTDLIEQIYNQSYQQVPNEVGKLNIVDLRKRAYELLQNKRYNIILDDVWSIDVWESIRYVFPESNKRSRLILTTRDDFVAYNASKSKDPHIYNLTPLTWNDAWALFRYHLHCPREFIDVAKSLVKKCAGLPLAILALCGILSYKDATTWERIDGNLGGKLEGNEKLDCTYQIISLSYASLKPHLKTCFLYTCLFPGSHLIRSARLTRLWIAEGLVEQNDGSSSPEEIAESYVMELITRNLLQIAKTSSDGRLKLCSIHDLFREILTMKSRNQNFAARHNEDCRPSSDVVRRLVVHDGLTSVQQKLHQLRFLLVISLKGALSNSSIQKLFNKRFKFLTVLDLQDTPLKKLPLSVFELLLMRYLNLKGTQLRTIPSSIGKLKKLEILDLKHTFISDLPVEVCELKRLRHLLLYHYQKKTPSSPHVKYGFRPLNGIGGLQSLRKLCFIEADNESGDVVEEVGMLTRLQRLGIVKLSKENGKKSCLSIEKLTDLQALSVTSLPNETMDLQDIETPPMLIKRLYLTGQLEKLPKWIASLQHLNKIFLKMSRLNNDPLRALEHLGNLVHLELVQAYNGKKLCFRAKRFRCLKVLGLHEICNLELLKIHRKSMPRLEMFTIRDCKLLGEIPWGMQGLLNLNTLNLVDMPLKLIETIRPPLSEGIHYHRVRHVPQVHVIDQVYERLLTMNIVANDYQEELSASGSVFLKPGDSRFTNLIKECDQKIAEESGDVSGKSLQTESKPSFEAVAPIPTESVPVQAAIPPAKPKYRHEHYQMAKFFGGALLGAKVSQLLSSILSVKRNADAFEEDLIHLESSLESVKPKVECLESILRGCNRHKDIAEFYKLLKNGVGLVKKCSEVHHYNIYMKQKLSEDLQKMDVKIVRFCNVDLQLMMEFICRNEQLSSSSSSAPPEAPSFTVGLEEPLKELKKKLLNNEETVHVLCAPGGCGKTTLAKKLCNDSEIKGIYGMNIYFLAISRSPNETTLSSLKTRCIEAAFTPKLVVLDDVWSGSEHLIDEFSSEVQNVKILITSRHGLKRYRSLYKLKPLNDGDAKELFCHSAFHPGDRGPYEDLLNKVVRSCCGFPLALTVFGGSLKGKVWPMWRQKILDRSRGQIIRGMEKKVLEVLRWSLDDLDHFQRESFLDLSLFPEDVEIPAAALIDISVESYKQYATLVDMSSQSYNKDYGSICALYYLHQLNDRKLAKIVVTREEPGEVDSSSNYLFVTQHDLLRQLGIHESNQEEVEHRPRLIIEIKGNYAPVEFKILNNQPSHARFVSITTDEKFTSNWGNLQIPDAEVLILNVRTKSYVLPYFIRRMTKLKILIITNYGLYPTELENLQVLGSLTSLRIIRFERISFRCHDFNGMHLNNLKKMSFVKCGICQALKNCRAHLSEMLPTLEEIDINYCNDLMEFPPGIAKIVSLKKFSLTNCHGLSTLPEALGALSNLEILRLHSCAGLLKLPDSVICLQKLRLLDISDCCSLKQLPEQFGLLSNLETIVMGRNSSLSDLPESVLRLSNLKCVHCDEEADNLWKYIKRQLRNITFKVQKKDANLNRLLKP